MDELTDPGTLRERDDIEFCEMAPETHQSHFELYESIAGLAIVGVTDADGRLLLLEHEDAPYPTLPYGRVAPADRWVATTRATVADSTGVAVTVDDMRRVRHHTYRSEADEETTGYDVVVAASPEGDGDIPAEAGQEWVPTWRDTATIDLPDEPDNDVLNDIRLFVD
ncbi:hypothetical protein [Halococcus qingdaonensis]|uniref:hypothetical protein n=1 Tax=Halococcus qingdaonensis TaxID=224402 RepID=UPI00211681EB|nr:hypothetical protein [Halococcus qingdaonensis]